MVVGSVEVNITAIMVGALVNMVVGMFWYSPKTFGKVWMKLSGITEKKIDESKKKGMTKNYIIALISALVMTYVLAHFIVYLNATTISEGLQAGFWLWLGFIATTMTGIVLWEGKPWKLYLINSSYYLAVLLINGAILAIW